MLKHNEINPLAVFGLRRVDHCPPHFVTVPFDLRVSEKTISDWIWEHLSGRFYYGEFYTELASGALHGQKIVAFEEPGEASYFALMVDTVNQPHELNF